MSMDDSCDVIIIGAGAAGLAAASVASIAGHRVIVLEARDRIGGRVFTRHVPSSPAPIELGAEFIHGKPPEILEILQSRHLQFHEVNEQHWNLRAGTLSKSGDFWSQLKSILDQIENYTGEDK